jgi:serine/threonine protein kinase
MRRRPDLDEGGKPIAAGGFGCVFLPRLRCKDKNIEEKLTRSGKKYVSKLMMNKEAADEEREMMNVSEILRTIPKSSSYFLLADTHVCSVDTLSSSDLEGFNKKCNPLLREGLEANNINNRLNRVKSINIPYGGEELSDFMDGLSPDLLAGNKESEQQFGFVNLALVKLLNSAIVPMNQAGLLHHDLKAANILIEPADILYGKVPLKIIDWGLAVSTKHAYGGVPQGSRSRPMQFNLPFGVILLSDSSKALIGDYMKSVRADTPGQGEAKTIAVRLIQSTIARRGRGHIKYIMAQLKSLTNPYFSDATIVQDAMPTSSCYTSGLLAFDYIVDNISDIIIKYTKEGKFQRDRYFNEVYTHNVDVWGFLTAYMDLISHPPSYKLFRMNKLFRGISDLVFKYCFGTQYASRPIPINILSRELTDLNNLIRFNNKPLTKPATPPRATTPPRAISIRSSPKAQSVVSLRGRKRCPKGYKKNKKTQKCVKKGTKQTRKSPPEISLKGKKRCPKGFNKNPKTGKCKKKR